MRTLFILLITTNLMADCTIELVKKSEKAKTVYLDGVTIPVKIRKALSSQCELKVKLMSKTEVKELQIKALEAKLSKLKG